MSVVLSTTLSSAIIAWALPLAVLLIASLYVYAALRRRQERR